MSYFQIAARNGELIVIDNMETFSHYFCYRTKQKKGEVIEEVLPASPEGSFEEGVPSLAPIPEEIEDHEDDIL